MIALLAGFSGAWADVLPNAVVGTAAFQATALTTGASGHTITKDGSGNVSISPNSGNLGTYPSNYLTCTLVVKINVPSTTTAGVLCQMRQTSGEPSGAQGLYMGAERKLTTSWENGGRKSSAGETQLTAGEHTIIYTAGISGGGAKVYIDGTTTTLTDTGLKAGSKYYKAIYIPAAYAQYVTEVHFYSSIQDATNITSIVTECSNHIYASQETGAIVTVPSGKTLVIDSDNNLSKYSFGGASNIIIASGKTLSLDKDGSTISSLTGCGTALQSSAITTTVTGNLPALTLKATAGTLKYTGTNLSGSTLDGVVLASSQRIDISNTVTIKNLAGNDLTAGSYNYVFVSATATNLILEGTCDFTHKANGDAATYNNISIGNTSGSITVKSGANVSCGKIWYSNDKINAPITVESGATLTASDAINASTITNNGTITSTGRLYANTITNNGTITALKLQGATTLGEGSTTTLSDATPFAEGAVTVTGDATLNLTATTAALSQAITIAADKTLTIDGASNTVNLNVVPTFNTGSKINFTNATINYEKSIRNLANYTFTSSTAQFTETGTEYAAGGFTITNIPDGVTVKVKKYDATDYETKTPTDGTVTISHEVGVSGLAAWLDYTFNETTLATNQPATPIGNIPNRGNAGSGQTLTIDNSKTSAVSYNSDGTFKVRYTPYRGMTWPENYTVAVSGNFPDVENGCLVAFGTKSGNYLALIRGANSNEIKLVKGQGDNTYTNIQTMAAENATAAAHLVVFTKQGNVFKVYCDGVNVATTTYDQTLGNGLQVGSIHGGYDNTGVMSVMDNSLTDDQKNAVFCNAIRVYDYIISNAQMDALKSDFPYISQGGNYTRTISANANLDAEDAWYNVGEETNTNLPTNNIVEEVTYYPDIVVTTTAASTLTVNANMDSRNIEFDGAGKLTIASDGTHSISIKGSVTANGPISVKYGAIDMSAVPVSIGESGSIEFDFSDYDFSEVTTSTDYPVTGLTSNYGVKVTALYPSDIYHTYSLAFNGTTNSYYLTVGPSVALKQKQAIDLVTPYYNGNHVGAGLGKYTISLGETSYANIKDFGDAVTAWATLVDCVEPTIAINMPTNGFYRFTSQNNQDNTGNVGKYLHNYLTSGAIALNSTEDKTTIFYVDRTSNLLLSYDNGLYLNNYNVEPAVGESFTWTIEEGTELGKYALKMGTTWYASDWNTTDNITYGRKDANALWAIEPVESLPITFNAEYASFYSPVDLTIPDNANLKVYTGTLNGGYLHLDEVEGTLPANTGVILHLDNWSERTVINFPVLSTTTSGSSDLTGIIATETVVANTKLVLGKVDDTWGIYSYNNTTLNGFKAYMNMPSTPVKGFTFDLDDAVGIRSFDNGQLTKDNAAIYNIAGQKMNKLQKGLNIVNGKKVLVK